MSARPALASPRVRTLRRVASPPPADTPSTPKRNYRTYISLEEAGSRRTDERTRRPATVSRMTQEREEGGGGAGLSTGGSAPLPLARATAQRPSLETKRACRGAAFGPFPLPVVRYERNLRPVRKLEGAGAAVRKSKCPQGGCGKKAQPTSRLKQHAGSRLLRYNRRATSPIFYSHKLIEPV